MIEIKELVKKYHTAGKEVRALEGINLTVREGEIYGIIGPSGAGKSTLLRTVNLLERPTSGRVLIKGQDLTLLNPAELREKRKKIGMIFQHFNLLYSRTVRENISFPLEISGLDKKERKERVDKLLVLVGLTERADYYPAQLSGGQKQRVGIARALANEPEYLLSDEATSSLDPESTDSILELLLKIRDEMRITILLITHEMEVIKKVCDRVAVMEKGQIIEKGKVLDLFVNPVQQLTKNFISSVVNFNLPPQLRDWQQDRPVNDSLIRVSFIGAAAHRPFISSLIRNYDLEANILYGNIDQIQDVPFGIMVLQLTGSEEQKEEGIEYLLENGLYVEVL